MPAAKAAVSPLSDAFDLAYFRSLITDKTVKLSAKAFLATGQRIPGLGNGVLHDILFGAGVHPKRRLNTLPEAGLRGLFDSVKSTLAEMTARGGRDTERDLFGRPGGYPTKMNKNAVEHGCPACGGAVTRETYLGGSVIYCGTCQKA